MTEGKSNQENISTYKMDQVDEMEAPKQIGISMMPKRHVEGLIPCSFFLPKKAKTTKKKKGKISVYAIDVFIRQHHTKPKLFLFPFQQTPGVPAHHKTTPPFASYFFLLQFKFGHSSNTSSFYQKFISLLLYIY